VVIRTLPVSFRPVEKVVHVTSPRSPADDDVSAGVVESDELKIARRVGDEMVDGDRAGVGVAV